MLQTPFQALIEFHVAVLAVVVTRWYMRLDEGSDWLIDKAGELSFNLRGLLQRSVDVII